MFGEDGFAEAKDVYIWTKYGFHVTLSIYSSCGHSLSKFHYNLKGEKGDVCCKLVQITGCPALLKVSIANVVRKPPRYLVGSIPA